MNSRSGIPRRLIFGLVAGLLLICSVTVALVVGARALTPSATIAQQEEVASDGARAVSVTIEMPGGTLEMGGGVGALLEADFRYSDKQAQPRVRYERQGQDGVLVVRQPQQEQPGLRRAVNRWQLRLDRQTPLDLLVNAGPGAHSLDLRSLNLQTVDILPNEGMMAVNLAGYWAEDVAVALRGGSGLLVITLPQGMGARVELQEHRGEVTVDGLHRANDSAGLYVNNAYAASTPEVRVLITGHQGEVTLKTGLPGDLPVREALKLAKTVYSKHGTFDCAQRLDDGRYLSTDMVNELWFDYLCERGPEHRAFDGDDPLTQELAAAEMVDRIRRDYYRSETEVTGATMKFNAEEFLSATLDMLMKARSRPENAEFSLTHFMGSFTYSVVREGDRLRFTIENQTDLASGTHLPMRFPDAGYTQSLETLVAQEPQLADAFLLELVQSSRYPIISILAAKSRQETRESLDEGGGTLAQTFTWSEPYLPNFDDLPPWPDYVRELDLH